MRFPHGAPSLVDCTELRVDGDVRFGKDVVLQGKVRLVNEGDEPLNIADGTVIRGE